MSLPPRRSILAVFGDVLLRLLALSVILLALLACYIVAIGSRSPILGVLLVVVLVLSPWALRAYTLKRLRLGAARLDGKAYALSASYSAKALDLLTRWPGLAGLVHVGFLLTAADARVQAQTNLGAAQTALGDYAAARRNIEAALARGPNDARSHHNMGVLRLHSEGRDAALEWFRKAWRLGFLADVEAQLTRAWMIHFRFADGRLAPIPEAPAPPDQGLVGIDLINDDKTSMEFVVHVLEQIFGLVRKDAVAVMLAVHDHGRATAVMVDPLTAQSLIARTIVFAREEGFPLQLEQVAAPAA